MSAQITRYAFSHAICGFFEIPSADAKVVLPVDRHPLEPHHGISLLAVSAFDFVGSEVGAYGEVTLSIVVAPLFRPNEPLPKAALYPFQVATSTRVAREHAIERWHLPHWMENITVEWTHKKPHVTARVECENHPLMELTITERNWQSVAVPFQLFTREGNDNYFTNIVFEGSRSEHEDEQGSVTFFEHSFYDKLAVSEISTTPTRELWMVDGMQTFQPLEKLGK
jgi:hypothetical protein